MSYSKYYQNIKSIFPELDLLKEPELLTISVSAKETIELCILLCENASKRLNIDLNLGVLYDYTFNASAKIKHNSATIIFNLGLIDKLEIIISDSLGLFMHEDIASLTIQSHRKTNLKTAVKNCCIKYLFYHELAHVIQLLDLNLNATLDLQEQYSNEAYFEIKNHIYEMDADNFGSVMSIHSLVERIKKSDYRFESMTIFNALTFLMLSIANVIIEFSGNFFKNICYKENSHPHPLIRIIKCQEQMLAFVSENLNVFNPLLETALQRTGTMISQIIYSNGRKVNYPVLCSENFDEISNYIDEIENLYQNYKELTTHKTQKICSTLIM